MKESICPRVLTIAGSDSGGGAGIQGDLKTFAALGCYGMSVITAVTAQNTIGIAAIHLLPAAVVTGQLDAVLEDIGVDAVKIGMVASRENIEGIVECLSNFHVEKIVADTVMEAKNGVVLLPADVRDVFARLILPLALVVTPNVPEAEAITGRKISSVTDIKDAARDMIHKGARNVVIKGGHLNDKKSADVFYDGNDFTVLEAERIMSKNTHGTGCALSAAIAANLAKGMDLRQSIKYAKDYVTGAIRTGLPLGKGHGPLNHFWNRE